MCFVLATHLGGLACDAGPRPFLNILLQANPLHLDEGEYALVIHISIYKCFLNGYPIFDEANAFCFIEFARMLNRNNG